MRRAMLLATLAAVTALGACKKTGENEMEVSTPDVDVNVSENKDTVRTPDVDVGTKQDTLIVNRPTVDVNRGGDTATKKTP
jgi:hypothetical protein